MDPDERRRLPSDDGRVFLALRVRPSPALRNVVAAVDAALQAFGKEPYFAEPIFHVSVAEEADLSGDTCADSGSYDLDSDDDLYATSARCDDEIVLSVSRIVCKCGHRRFELPLPVQ